MLRTPFNAMSAAFESLGLAVVLLDRDLRIVEASPASRGILGTPDLAGHNIGEFVELNGISERLAIGGRATGICRLQANGAKPSLNVSAAPLPDGGFEDPVRYVMAIELRDPMNRQVAVEEAEKIRRALEDHRWRRTAAARALGISRATLWRRMREHGLL